MLLKRLVFFLPDISLSKGHPSDVAFPQNVKNPTHPCEVSFNLSTNFNHRSTLRCNLDFFITLVHCCIEILTLHCAKVALLKYVFCGRFERERERVCVCEREREKEREREHKRERERERERDRESEKWQGVEIYREVVCKSRTFKKCTFSDLKLRIMISRGLEKPAHLTIVQVGLKSTIFCIPRRSVPVWNIFWHSQWHV